MITQCEMCDGEFENTRDYINHFPACNRKQKQKAYTDQLQEKADNIEYTEDSRL